LYVDDNTFLFETRNYMTRGSQVIYGHYAGFGLVMHTGIEGKTSKTEALHIPKRLDEEAIPAGTKVDMDKGMYFHFTDAILYIGSITKTCLCDSKDIAARISKAYGTMGALDDFFSRRDVPLNIKLKLYLTIQINTVLWGCETWALLDSDVKAIKTFHHRSRRQILGISKRRLREERINNDEVRSRFLKIPDIYEYLTKITLRYIGKTIQNDQKALQKQFLIAFTHSPKKSGGQQQTHRDDVPSSIRTLIPDLQKDAPLKQWATPARDLRTWDNMSTEWWQQKGEAKET
jgi:hypothetical protein